MSSASDSLVEEIIESWNAFCSTTEALLTENGSSELEVFSHIQTLCKHGLKSAVIEHFLFSLEENFKKSGASKFWQHFDCCSDVAALQMKNDYVQKDGFQQVLCKALEVLFLKKQSQEKCLSMLVHALESCEDSTSDKRQNVDAERLHLFSKYQLMVSSVLTSTIPQHYPEILHCYFKGRLQEAITILAGDFEDGNVSQNKEDMAKGVENIRNVVHNLISLGFTFMTEDAYASAIISVVKGEVRKLAGDSCMSSVLESIKRWIKGVPLQWLLALLPFPGDPINYDSPASGLKSFLASHQSFRNPRTDDPAEGLIRWELTVEYFAFEMLQDVRIAQLFEIIEDYPDSSPAIGDLQKCLEHTGQHSKLGDSFISALRSRLLNDGASSNDIWNYYISNIKTFQIIDPTGLFFEVVGEEVKGYLKGRKDKDKCIETMLTDLISWISNRDEENAGDSLLEKLSRDEENQENTGVDDDISTDDKQAWINAQCWEPDLVDADPLKSSQIRRKVDIFDMVVSIIGSPTALLSEYHVLLAKKLLKKSDYEIDSEICNFKLIETHFCKSRKPDPEKKIQLLIDSCRSMLIDMISSKMENADIKEIMHQQFQAGDENLGEDILNATIISSTRWPPVQDEALNIPEPVDQLLSDYAKTYRECKPDRKLLWKKTVGRVKLELQFEDRSLQFTISPVLASIIMKFEDQTSWTSKDLADAIGLPADVLDQRINFWISEGILSKSLVEDSNDHLFTLVDGMNGGVESLMNADEAEESSVDSVEVEKRKQITAYQELIVSTICSKGGMTFADIVSLLRSSGGICPKPNELMSFLDLQVAVKKLQVLKVHNKNYYVKK